MRETKKPEQGKSQKNMPQNAIERGLSRRSKWVNCHMLPNVLVQ